MTKLVHSMLCAAAIAAALAAAPAKADLCWGYNTGSVFQVSSTNPGGWTSYASIDAAVTAAVGAGRSTVEFDGTWTGITETIKLRNSGLTFAGTTSTSMTWAANKDAFGGMNNSNFNATISGLSVTTSGTGRGVAWTDPGAWNGVYTISLTLSNSTFNSAADVISIARAAGTGGGGCWESTTITANNSSITSTGGHGIVALGTGGGSLVSVRLSDTRLSTYRSGINATGFYGPSTDAAPAAVTVTRSEIVSNNAAPAAGDSGIAVARNRDLAPLVVTDTLIAGFGKGISAEAPAMFDGLGQGIALINNTIVGTGSSSGVVISFSPGYSNNYDSMSAMLVNNIIAGHTLGISVAETADIGGSIAVYGDKNAYFANTTNRTGSGTYAFSDANRIEPGYTLAQAFVNPTGGDYQLLATALALLDSGEQFTTSALGGTATFVDFNDNGTYQDGTDYVIDLGGGTPTASTKLFLVDADVSNPLDRLANGQSSLTVDVGAYEYQVAPEPATMGFLAFGGLAMMGAIIRRRRQG
ncbi:MAG: PEP-CTERM sorting domain-containing protein [Phycisphaerae bacterium]|nr:PEP-CTERM sorting domain-containing protein [Phycisphaerae bacterium]